VFPLIAKEKEQLRIRVIFQKVESRFQRQVGHVHLPYLLLEDLETSAIPTGHVFRPSGTHERRILNQLSLPTPAAILARVLAPIPTD
jgi:hypothetical protein